MTEILFLIHSDVVFHLHKATVVMRAYDDKINKYEAEGVLYVKEKIKDVTT